MLKKIILQKGKEKSLQRFHPWVFSGAVLKKDGGIADGDMVEVVDYNHHYLATGHYFNSSICVRVFSFEQVLPDADFWKQKILKAIAYRRAISLLNNEKTTMFRLINGEGDELPGLIADWFDGHVVLQFHSYGMYLLKQTVVSILLELFSGEIKSIYNKSEATLPELKSFSPKDELLFAAFDEVLVQENGIPFYIDIIKGQKTGFFIDQRENRDLVRQFTKGKRVLNLFCYTGGFSSYAVEGGASLVHSVDISKKAIEFTDKNIAMCAPKPDVHQSFADNVFDFMEKMESDFYDVIILDPPAFAKHHKVKEQGIKGYRAINRRALEKIKSGGFLFTFSCSQAISQEEFQTIIFSAAAMEHKKVRIVKHLQHAMDHPISIFHPEGSYLNGLLLYVE